MNKRVFICAGGTGGHLFPAIALAHDLLQRDASIDLLFVGGGLSTNRYFDRKAFDFHEVACGSIVSKKPWDLMKSAFAITRGIVQSYGLLSRQRPDVMVGFGSFYGFPPLVAATTMGIPLILYAADAVPGRVLRLMSPRASMTGLHLGAASTHLKGPSVTVGMPIRSEILADRTDAASARQELGLDPELPTLLIFGGSQGAKALNQLMLQAIPFLTPQLQQRLQVIHLTGQEDCVEALSNAYSAHGIRNNVKVFEPRMGIAWSAATTALCRSGASTLAELRYFAVPAILVPYPFATDNHQDKNADVHVTSGCALKAQQQTLTPQIIATLLARLLNNHENCHNSMREALQKVQLDPPQKSLADVVLDTLNHAKL